MQNATKIHLITFYNGEKYKHAAERLKEQAVKCNMFHSIKIYSEKDLQNDKKFWSAHKEFILKNQKGSGFYIWKPWVFFEGLKLINDGDILLYLDAGCEINSDYSYKFVDLMNITLSKKFIHARASSNDDRYTKHFLKSQFNLSKDELMKPQPTAGVIMGKKCLEIITLTKKWLELASIHENINNLSCGHTENSNFICHRHDQSILSMLLKTHGLYNPYIKSNIDDPIRILRTKCSISQL